MADLSAYIDFNVTLDLPTGTIKVTDAGSYPGGVPPGITGIVRIKQPDGIAIPGDWLIPDIYYVGSALVPSIKPLRKTSTNQLQRGAYEVMYTVRHAGYDDTVLVKSFSLDYVTPKPVIEKSFDVFTPQLLLTDSTNYAGTNLTINSVVRSWSVQVGTVGLITGSGASIVLVYGGYYYDAVYNAIFTSTINYTHATYAFLTIKDFITTAYIASANTPPAFAALRGMLNIMKNRAVSACRCGNCEMLDKFDKAFLLYFHIRDTICNNDPAEAFDYLQDFLDIYYKCVSPYVNLNVPILAYDLSFCPLNGGGGGGGTGLDIAELTSADFSNTTDYVNTNWNGKTLYILMAEANRQIFRTIEYTNLAGGGFRVLMPDFDASLINYHFLVFIKP